MIPHPDNAPYGVVRSASGWPACAAAPASIPRRCWRKPTRRCTKRSGPVGTESLCIRQPEPAERTGTSAKAWRSRVRRASPARRPPHALPDRQHEQRVDLGLQQAVPGAQARSARTPRSRRPGRPHRRAGGLGSRRAAGSSAAARSWRRPRGAKSAAGAARRPRRSRRPPRRPRSGSPGPTWGSRVNPRIVSTPPSTSSCTSSPSIAAPGRPLADRLPVARRRARSPRGPARRPARRRSRSCGPGRARALSAPTRPSAPASVRAASAAAVGDWTGRSWALRIPKRANRRSASLSLRRPLMRARLPRWWCRGKAE